MSKSKKIIGIDLGSYNSAVSVYQGSEIVIIPNSEGSLTTPSYVSIIDGEIKVGEPAKRQATLKPENVIFNIKRLMGKTYEQVKDLKRPYKIVNNNGKAAVSIDGRVYSPEEISAMILQKMKKTTEDFLGEEVENAIITKPAFYNSEENESVKNAGVIAGFDVKRVISEPTAAILNIKDNVDKYYCVVDAGGQTFDASVVNSADGVYEILASDGDLDLGGSTIDEKIVNFLIAEFKKDENVDLSKDPMALQRLFEASEKAKIELSNSTQTDINLPYITAIDGVPKHLVRTITRSKFDQLCDDFVNRIIEITTRVMEKSGKQISDINDVILVGGSTRIPLVQDRLEKMFGKKPSKALNPDTCVSTGACIQGGVMTGEVNDILLLDVSAIPFGIETQGGVNTIMIQENTTIPCEKTEIFSTAQDNQSSVEVHVVQGSRALAKDNKSLGRFIVDGIAPGRRGSAQIEITFSIDVNGILSVKAIDKNTGKENKIKIENSNSLSKEEIERMKQDAVANAEADKKVKEEIEKLNGAETIVFSSENFLSENSNIEEDDKNRVQEKITALKEAISSKNIDELENLKTELQNVVGEVYGKLSNQTGSDTGTSPNDDKTSDVEFEEVNS